MRTSQLSLKVKQKRRWKSESPAFTKEESAKPKNWAPPIRAACEMLHLRGFSLYRNERNDTLAACSSGFIFEFERVTVRLVQKFCAWFQSYESTQAGLAALPRGVRAFRIRKPKVAATASVKKHRIAENRPSIIIQGSHSTVPGHYAELDWNDLRKRY